VRRRPRIVALGGGTGLAALLRGLKGVTDDLKAIVTLTDDGGSSGRLRRALEMPPPGDIRNCLVALAEDESFMARVFQHRFSRGELAGHSFGNLFLAALTEVVGSFDEAVAATARVLAIEGSVLPATTHPAALVAEMEDGRIVAGETAVAADRHGVRRLFLSPPDATANPRAVEALGRADLIVLGPGSLFTSTLPPLLVPGLRDALLAAHAPRVYVCNLLQQPGETIGYAASQHLERLHQHVGTEAVDAVLVPSRPVVTDRVPVEFDREELRALGVQVMAGRIADGHHHEPEATARALARIARAGMEARELR
jgi:uncharacterized cofD-like protein